MSPQVRPLHLENKNPEGEEEIKEPSNPSLNRNGRTNGTEEFRADIFIMFRRKLEKSTEVKKEDDISRRRFGHTGGLNIK